MFWKIDIVCDKFLENMMDYGNISVVSIFILFLEFYENGLLKLDGN